MFTLEVKTARAERKFELTALAAQDLLEPLRIFAGVWKKRTIERYKQQNFAPLAPATIAKRAQKGLRQLERKLRRDVGRAMGRARKARGGRAGLLTRMMTSPAVRHALEDAVSARSRGVQNRQAVLAAFESRHRRPLLERAAGRELSAKQELSLAGREARAVTRAIGQPILGQLPRTVGTKTTSEASTLRSKTHEVWSDAHNKGATVGHQAVLPQRETIELEDEDLRILEHILRSHHLLPFQEGAHGPGY